MTQNPQHPDDPRFAAWLDADMDEAERQAFEREIEADSSLRQDLESYQRTVEVLRRLPAAAAPTGFLGAVQHRIRRRTRGRHFGLAWRPRLPIEAAFSLILIIVLMALYLLAVPVVLEAPIPVDPATFRIDPNQMLAVEVLAPYGPPRRVEGVFEVRIDPAAWAKLEADLGRYPQLELLGAPTDGGEGRLLVRVATRARPKVTGVK
jgi:hypothetical protein